MKVLQSKNREVCRPLIPQTQTTIIELGNFKQKKFYTSKQSIALLQNAIVEGPRKSAMKLRALHETLYTAFVEFDPRNSGSTKKSVNKIVVNHHL